MGKERYYLSSFFWSTATKILNALVGFVSVPLLIGQFGRAEYGILTLALSFNAYMHLLDLGMNTGAVRYFSMWKASGELDLKDRVARTNISFYTVIGIINAVILLSVAFFGEGLFSISHEQFILLRWCLLGLAVLSVFSWVSTVFNQLLVADLQMAFTMKMQFIQVVLKLALIILTLKASLALPTYFFFLNLLIAGLLVPYAVKCRRNSLISSFKPAFYWKDFSVVLVFSLSIFALSFFQITATESRALVLGICYPDSANTLTDFRIISVVPTLIIAIGGTLSSIFLPGSSEMVAKDDREGIERFAYKWTRYTSVIANILCVPFILCAREVLCAYVGESNAHLTLWMQIWCLTVLIQIHTTPGNSLVLAYGRTKELVFTTAASCILSIVLNVVLCRHYGVGSAVISYFVYVCIVIGLYYMYYYRKVIGLKRHRMMLSFLVPTVLSFAVYAICAYFIKLDVSSFPSLAPRLSYICICVIKTLAWLIPYALILLATRTVRLSEFSELKKK